jgi:hypothetical protein
MQFLSSEWMTALADVAATVTTSGFEGSPMAVGIEVATGEITPARWRFVFAGTGMAVDTGEAQVTMHLDRATAIALAGGELNAQRALADSRLTISGDIQLLAAHSDALTAIGDVFATLRPVTIYG